MSAEIRQIPDQQRAINKAASPNGHLGLAETYVCDHHPKSCYGCTFSEIPPNSGVRSNGDYLKVLNLVVTLTNQYGFQLIIGGIQRHKKHEWEKYYFDPRHQLALACYLAYINTRAYPQRQEAYDRLSAQKPKIADGLWGISKGALIFTGNNPDNLSNAAQTRLEEKRAICLPWVELQQGLAAIPFMGDDADRMSNQEFETAIVPLLKPVLDPILDVEKALEVYV